MIFRRWYNIFIFFIINKKTFYIHKTHQILLLFPEYNFFFLGNNLWLEWYRIFSFSTHFLFQQRQPNVFFKSLLTLTTLVLSIFCWASFYLFPKIIFLLISSFHFYSLALILIWSFHFYSLKLIDFLNFFLLISSFLRLPITFSFIKFCFFNHFSFSSDTCLSSSE